MGHPRAGRIIGMMAAGSIAALAAAWLTPDPGNGHKRGTIERSANALTRTLLRCQALGDGALADAGCRAAWTEHRRHFLEAPSAPEPRL